MERTSGSSGPRRAPLDLPAEEFGRRIRAARAYSRLTLVDLAERISVDRKRLQAIELGQRRLRLGEQDALAYAVAEACELPEGWIAEAFSAGGGGGPVLDELRALSARVDELAELVRRVVARPPNGTQEGRPSRGAPRHSGQA
jgi:transcriptional regulator with XRE-family HTH domain